MDNIPESILLKIFSYLRIGELLRVSRVNSGWRRVAHDWHLWQEVSLAKYSKNIPDLKLRKLIKNIFSIKLRYLELSKFNISSGTLNLLRKYCPQLKTLILENVTFYESKQRAPDFAYFPRNLRELNVTHSIGPASVFRNMMESLETDTLECLGVCDGFLENRCAFLNFFLRQRFSLKILEFSFCKEIRDDSLAQIIFCCKNLRSIYVRRCCYIQGNFLKSIFVERLYLRSLILDGTMIRDELLKGINWNRCLLIELDLSWSRHVTEDGLLHTLPPLRFLRYLRVSCCGYGHALTDKVLQAMARETWRFLQLLDVSKSYEITNEGLEVFLQKCPNLHQISKTNCHNLR